MKALTLTQPWATLVALGEKQVETRSWGTSYRGPLAIHAAKSFPESCRDLCHHSPFLSTLRSAGIIMISQLPLGKVIATCTLQDCIRTDIAKATGIVKLESLEMDFGDYGPGRWAWLLSDIEELSEPITAKGALGLWNWDMPR